MDKNIFDKIEVRQEKSIDWILCPFCEYDYDSEEEIRKGNTCPICLGTGSGAKNATNEVEEIKKHLNDYSINEIEEMVRKLSIGLHRSEFRTFWRKKMEVTNEKSD